MGQPAQAHERVFLAMAQVAAQHLPWQRLMEIISHAWYRADPVAARTSGPRYMELGAGPAGELISKAERDPALHSHIASLDGLTPVVLNADYSGIGLMAVQLHRCSLCQTWMVRVDDSKYLFPAQRIIDVSSQLARAGWQRMSMVWDDTIEQCICQRCADEGKLRFICVLCQQSRSSTESKLSFGLPAEHLCTTCYATVPAQQWEAMITALEQKHRLDYL